MSHSHHHIHGEGLSKRKLLFATLLNFIITAAEAVGGLLTNSLALLSDALHNLGDAVAILIAYIANRASNRDSNTSKTFGYKRIEILAALFNAVVLIVIIVFLFIEAFHRLKNPLPIKGVAMLAVAVIGFLANLAAIMLLKSDKNKNINIRAAYLHLLGDTISSIAVIIGSVFIVFFKIYWIDPVITFIIGIYLLKETFGVLMEAVDILMQGSPRDIDLEKIKKSLEKIEGVENIHHIHAWRLNDAQVHFECHIDLDTDMRMSETSIIKESVEKFLEEEGISHVTTQFEYNCCDNKEMIHNHANHN